jgi:hypothetical protein
MNTFTPTSFAPAPAHSAVPLPLQDPRSTPASAAPERVLPMDAGAVEHASWLRLLRQRMP